MVLPSEKFCGLRARLSQLIVAVFATVLAAALFTANSLFCFADAPPGSLSSTSLRAAQSRTSTARGPVVDCWKPLYAGFWYDKDPLKLRKDLKALFTAAAASSDFHTSFPQGRGDKSHDFVGENIVAAIVPHAAYQFSGLTAARVYNALKGRRFARIFIMGPAHREHFHGCALPTATSFCTPLGTLATDEKAITELRKYPFFGAKFDAPKKEHSIEMQLPLIQQTFGAVPIIPIEVGDLKNEDEVKMVARILNKFVTHDDLIIVSTDFTHYGPRYRFQPFTGRTESLMQKIKTLDGQALRCISSDNLDGFVSFKSKSGDTICGYFPCAILLAMLPTNCKAHVLDYENSAHVNRAPDGNMVSYMGIVISRKSNTGTLK